MMPCVRLPPASAASEVQIGMISFAPMLTDAIRTIPDYPKPGILFRDITTLLGDATAFRQAIEGLSTPFAGAGSTRSSASRRAVSSWVARSPASSAPASYRSARRASCRTPRCASPIRSSTASMKWKCIATLSLPARGPADRRPDRHRRHRCRRLEAAALTIGRDRRGRLRHRSARSRWCGRAA